LSKTSSTVKLELYGLFKYLTSSKSPTTSRPSIFDPIGRAKWDSWSAAGTKYEKGRDAESRYIEIARTLGWTEGAPESRPVVDTAAEDIWDDDSDEGASGSHRGGSGGMGLSVSTIPVPPKVDDRTIHGLAVSNDFAGLTALLAQHPETDLNELDEFGYSPLHLACDRGSQEIVKLLLKQGADATIKDPDGLSPRELANVAGHNEIEVILASSN